VKHHAEFAAELPVFLAAVWQVFNETSYLGMLRSKTGAREATAGASFLK
jgi:hypothetical protein